MSDFPEVDAMIAKLRSAGLDAWDDIDDPAAFIRELRGGMTDDDRKMLECSRRALQFQRMYVEWHISVMSPPAVSDRELRDELINAIVWIDAKLKQEKP